MNLLRKLAGFLLALCTVCLMVPVLAFADDEVDVSAYLETAVTSVLAGDTFTADLYVKSEGGAAAAELDLKCEGGEINDITAEKIDNFDYSEDFSKISFFANAADTSKGLMVATITVKPSGNEPYVTLSITKGVAAQSGNVDDIKVILGDDAAVKVECHKLTKTAAKAAACTVAGNKEYWECSLCEKIFSDEKGTKETTLKDVTEPATGHTPEVITAVAATCTETGLTEGSMCSVCGEILSEQKEVAALGHKWGEWTVVKAATETEEGKEQRVCANNSSHIETRTIDKLEPASQEEPATPAAEEPTVPAEEPATQPSAPGTMFVDVPDGSNIYKPVAWAVNAGIVKGYSDNTFRPEDSCTREQFAIMMWRFAGQPDADISAANKFTDIASFSNNTSRKAVAWAVTEGIIQGFNDGHFGPQETVTRRQVVIMLWRWAGRPTATATTSFSDVKSSESTYKAIQWGSETSLVKGYADGTFKPEDDCQRQHIVIFLYRYVRNILHEDVN